MKWLCAGLSIAALTITLDARADDPAPPPLPPTPAPTGQTPPPTPLQPGVPAPVPSEPLPPSHRKQHRVDENELVQLSLESDAPGTYLQALTEHEGWVALRGRWRTHFVYARGVRWQPVCVAPCTMLVPPTLVYRVAGPRVTPSGEFEVGPRGGKEALRVEAGSRGAHVGGGIALGLGIPIAIVGIVLASFARETRTAGYVTGGIGLGLIGLGGVLLATSNTNVRRVAIGPQGLAF